MKKSSLLINEPPLQVLPSLAVAIGLNEAMVVQQLHYWLENPKGGVERDGHKWIFNTYEQWKENFPFWSESTIKRIFLNLEKMGIVISAQLDAHSHDQTKFYRLDYNKLCTLDEVKLIPSTGSNRDDVNRYTESQEPEIKSAETTPTETPLSVEWQIGLGAEKITIPSEEQAWEGKADIAVMNICRSGMDLQDLASAFIHQRRILPAKKTDAKGWANAFREMKQAGAKPEHIAQAIQKLGKDQMTIADPWSIKKTVIALAVPVQSAIPVHPKARTL